MRRRTFISMLFLLLTLPCSGHTVLTVNPGGGASYTSLYDANEALPNPLDGDYTISCSGSTNDTTAVLLGANVGAYELIVQGDATSGIFDDAKYQLVVGASVNAITAGCNHLILQNLQITGVAGSYDGIYLKGANHGIVVRNCLIQDFTRSGDYGGIGFESGTETDKNVYNNILWNCTNGITIEQGGRGGVYHNTLVHCTAYGIAVRKGWVVYTVKNNLIHGATTADYIASGTGNDVVSACNYTSDTSSPDGAGYQSKTFTFVDVGGEDFHLDAGEQEKYNCTDPSVAGLTVDFDTDPRVDFDAGADELVDAGGAKGAMSRRRHSQ